MFSTEIEAELITKAVSGNRDALQELLLARSDQLSRHVAAKMPPSLKGDISVEDILQETFVQAFQDIGKLVGRTGPSLSAWLKAITENRLRDTLKAKNRAKRGGCQRRLTGPADGQSSSYVELVDLLSADGDTPGGVAARREAVVAVQVGIAGLPSDQRQAVRLRYLNGKSLEETAVAMGRTPNAVRSLVHRAKQRLHHALRRSSLWFDKR